MTKLRKVLVLRSCWPSQMYRFLLLKTVEDCHIVTEEVVKGAGAIEFHEKQPNAMHEGHDLWLQTLKQRSEQ